MAESSFIQNIRRALGRSSDTPFAPAEATYLSLGKEQVDARAKAVMRDAEARADELMTQLQSAAALAGWKVARVPSVQEAAQYIRSGAQELEAHSILRSAHPILEKLGLEDALSGIGVELGVMALDESNVGASRSNRDAPTPENADAIRKRLRQRAIEADIGITGVDYAIAETGTCVLIPRKGVSRIVSLLPPVHIAVVERGQVLPSLDELFTLRRNDFMKGNLGSYMNLITGPSRSADIEYTLVTGVHGPGNVHMVLIG